MIITKKYLSCVALPTFQESLDAQVINRDDKSVLKWRFCQIIEIQIILLVKIQQEVTVVLWIIQSNYFVMEEYEMSIEGYYYCSHIYTFEMKIPWHPFTARPFAYFLCSFNVSKQNLNSVSFNLLLLSPFYFLQRSCCYH